MTASVVRAETSEAVNTQKLTVLTGLLWKDGLFSTAMKMSPPHLESLTILDSTSATSAGYWNLGVCRTHT